MRRLRRRAVLRSRLLPRQRHLAQRLVRAVHQWLYWLTLGSALERAGDLSHVKTRPHAPDQGVKKAHRAAASLPTSRSPPHPRTMTTAPRTQTRALRAAVRALGLPLPRARPDRRAAEGAACGLDLRTTHARRLQAGGTSLTMRGANGAARGSLTGTPRLWRAALPPVRANRVSGRAAAKLRRNTNTGPAVWQPSAYGPSPPGAEAGAAGAMSVERSPIS